MTPEPSRGQLARVLDPLLFLRASAISLESRYSDALARIDTSYRDSARNLLHYLAVRQNDIRHLQQDLIPLGLSSLGVLEPHVMASLNAVIGILERLTGDSSEGQPIAPVDFRTGPLLLRDHTRSLLGAEPANRHVRIMVTMPSEAASDPRLVEDMMLAGMDVMRINCAHDGPEAWSAMVGNLRQAEKRVGRKCRVQADLAGPKLRTGRIRAQGRVIRLKPQRDIFGCLLVAGRVWLTPAEHSGLPDTGTGSVISIDSEMLGHCEAGDVLRFTDTRKQRHKLRVVERQHDSCVAEIARTAYITEGTKIALERKGSVVAKARVSGVPEVTRSIKLFAGDQIILTRQDEPGRDALRDPQGKVTAPARIHCTLAEVFESVETGHSVWFDDGKIGGVVKQHDADSITIEITYTGPVGGKLKAGKGINFPDTRLNVSALTNKDRNDLKQIIKLVDMVALSFLHGPEDVVALQEALDKMGGPLPGVVLKIENGQAFKNLPQILLASLQMPPVGVMIARGDLAVEVGFERLSEVQEEVLWLCEAAHIPVIWATQILEGMAKKGAPSRAEVTDAAMSIKAECAMLNKGPNIIQTIRFLSQVIDRMDEHFYKRRATLRKLSVAHL